MEISQSAKTEHCRELNLRKLLFSVTFFNWVYFHREVRGARCFYNCAVFVLSATCKLNIKIQHIFPLVNISVWLSTRQRVLNRTSSNSISDLWACSAVHSIFRLRVNHLPNTRLLCLPLTHRISRACLCVLINQHLSSS